MDFSYDKYKRTRSILKIFILFVFLLFMSSCACLDPRNVDVELESELPAPKMTVFDKALSELGKMTEIYGTYKLKIQSIDIGDNTGTSKPTQYEIPQNISEMLISTLNAVGGNVVYIPYLPNYIYNMQNTGYSNFPGKILPDAVLTGGITEFDRGLDTRGRNTDFSVTTKPLSDAPDWFDSDIIGAEFSKAGKSSVARITLDFNLIDYQTLSGIPKMQTVNTIRVFKATAEKELGFSIFGPSFGLKGTIKKVQGRHAAIRLLVQLNVLQILGKFFDLPYWNLISEAKPDAIVIDTLINDFYGWDSLNRIVKIQEMLFLNGYDILISGVLDEQTKAALQRFDNSYTPNADMTDMTDADLFLKLYCSVPITNETLKRRYLFNQHLQNLIEALQSQDSGHSENAQPRQQEEADPAEISQNETKSTAKSSSVPADS